MIVLRTLTDIAEAIVNGKEIYKRSSNPYQQSRVWLPLRVGKEYILNLIQYEYGIQPNDSDMNNMYKLPTYNEGNVRNVVDEDYKKRPFFEVPKDPLIQF